MIRYSAGKLLSPRGAGLGNEVFPLAKAYLGALAFGARLIAPPWRLNKRRYDRELEDGGVRDTLKYYSVLALPSFDVTADVVRQYKQGDYLDIMLALKQSDAIGKAASLLHSSGMSFGYLGIRRAKPYLKAALLGAPSAVAAVAQHDPARMGRLTVGLHVRRGDFAGETIMPGKFNQQIPIEWYRAAIRELRRTSNLPLTIFVATDGDPYELVDQLEVEPSEVTFLDGTSVADMAVLAATDVILPSISSFSMLAIFLGDSHYLWHRDHLADNGGWAGIWSHEFSDEDSILTEARTRDGGHMPDSTRGIPFRQGDALPGRFVTAVDHQAQLRDWRSDLIYYGQVRTARERDRAVAD